MKMTAFWDVAPSSLKVVYRCFRSVSFLHHQDDRPVLVFLRCIAFVRGRQAYKIRNKFRIKLTDFTMWLIFHVMSRPNPCRPARSCCCEILQRPILASCKSSGYIRISPDIFPNFREETFGWQDIPFCYRRIPTWRKLTLWIFRTCSLSAESDLYAFRKKELVTMYS
jgi:hypothetical protein